MGKLKYKNLKLPHIDRRTRQLCGLVILLSMTSPFAMDALRILGLGVPVRLFGLPMLHVFAIAFLCWHSSELRVFIGRSFSIDILAWPGAFVIATFIFFCSRFVSIAWDVYVGVGSTSGNSDWITGTAPISGSQAGRLFIVTYFSSISVIVEEIVYRVLTLVTAPKLMNWITYSLLSASIFGLAHIVHGSGTMIWTAIWIGLPCAMLFYRTRNLGAVFIFHATINVMGFTIIFFGSSGESVGRF